MKRERYTAKQVEAALVEAKGIKTIAARLLGCSWLTVDRYCQRYASCRAVVENQRRQVVELAENHIWAAVNRGDLEICRWVLKTLGKDLGYTERQEVSTQLHAKVSGEVKVQHEWDNDRMAELLAILAEAGLIPTALPKEGSAETTDSEVDELYP